MNLYVGDLGLNDGSPKNVFSLNTHGLDQVAGGKSGTKAVKMVIGQTVKLPSGLGLVTFNGLKRFASLDIAYNPAEIWILLFALLAIGGLGVSLSVSRRRVWVRKFEGGFEVAALAHNDDPRISAIVAELVATIAPKKGRKK
jgi:cytochrome c biogenesis protein